jgi:hypothetical protein
MFLWFQLRGRLWISKYSPGRPWAKNTKSDLRNNLKQKRPDVWLEWQNASAMSWGQTPAPQPQVKITSLTCLMTSLSSKCETWRLHAGKSMPSTRSTQEWLLKTGPCFFIISAWGNDPSTCARWQILSYLWISPT